MKRILLSLIILSFSLASRSQDSTIYNLRMLDAAFKGNDSLVHVYLKMGANPNTTSWDGVSGLMYAAEQGNVKVAQHLIDFGADPNKSPLNGMSALTAAAAFDQADVLELLIKGGATISQADALGNQAIHYASIYGNYIPLDMLIFYGADPDAVNNDGLSPLHFCAFTNQYHITRLLLEKGVKMNPKDINGFTPLMSAAQNGSDSSLLALISKGALLNTRNNDSITALYLATYHKRDSCVKYLLDAGAKAGYRPKGKPAPPLYSWYNDRKGTYQLYSERDYKVHFSPRLNQVIGHSGMRFNGKDVFYQIGGGIEEAFTKIRVEGGFMTRVGKKRVLVKIMEPDVYYQLWESRQGFYLKFAKRTQLFAIDEIEGNVFADAGIRSIYTFGKYTAMNMKPDSKWIAVPFAGIGAQAEYAGVKIGYEYMDLGLEELGPHFIFIDFMYFIPFGSWKIKSQKIKYL